MDLQDNMPPIYMDLRYNKYAANLQYNMQPIYSKYHGKIISQLADLQDITRLVLSKYINDATPLLYKVKLQLK